MSALDVLARFILRRSHERLGLRLLFPDTGRSQSRRFVYDIQSIQSQDGGDDEFDGNDLALDPAERSQSPFP